MPGALALTPREAVCCVDELNLYKGDFGDFNNALESGKVEVTKIVKGTIETACSVLAGANPIAGNKKQFVNGTSYFLQLGFDYTTAQRFDGIYVLRDEANMVRDESISSKIIAASKEEPTDLTPIHNYIAYSKLIDPVLTDEAGEYISKRHAVKRRDSSGSDYMRSHRQVPSLIRFALATARFDLSEVATLEHVKFAEKILEITLNERDPGIMAGAAPAADRDHRKKVAKILVEYAYGVNAESISSESIGEYAKDKHKTEMSDKELRSMMLSFAANKETGLTKNKDGTFSYDGAQNPAYDMW
jgi:DNA replicative helicase MCM subunit Mcm2 (Cdc46/Mcm family)